LWSAVERFGQQFVQFGFSIVLARLLSPVEYGLMGMLTIFFAVAMGFSDVGFGMGLIQRKEITKDDETSVFFFNIIAGIVLTLLLCAISPLAAMFYRQPILKVLLCVSSLQFVFIPFGIVQNALMMRDMDFKTRALLGNTATFLSGAVGIGMAWKGCGVWSLVGQVLSRYLLLNSLIWAVRPWRPTGRFRWACIQSLWPFSSRLMATYLLNTIFDNAYSVIIGRLYQPADLGQFTRASGLAQLPGGTATDVITNVTLPAFSRMQNDTTRLKMNFRKTVRTLGAFHFPLMIGLAAVAGPLVRCLLTEKWMPCVPYLQILCFAGILFPLQAMHRNVLTALGRSDLVFRSEMIKKVIAVITVAATIWFGITALVWGILALSVLSYAVTGHYTLKLLGYGWTEQGRDTLPILALSLGMGLAVWAVGAVGAAGLGNGWLILTLKIVVGVVLYGVFALAGHRSIYADAFTTGGHLFRRIFPLAVS
jgi:O-antigen/teichoic acid export membrane protein